MHYRTFVGLDVHKSTVTACAWNPNTEEENRRTFLYEPSAIAEWIHSLEGPVQAVYESGFCGFSLYRSLSELEVDCVIAAVSKIVRPKGDKVKTDKRDARFLSRQLAGGNISKVTVPDIETENLRELSRLRATLRDQLTAAKHRVSQMVLRYGLRFGGKEKNWSTKHRSWLGEIEMPTVYAQSVFDYWFGEVLRLEDAKGRLEKVIRSLCKEEPLKTAVEAFCLIKGVSEITAFCVLVEIGNMARFKTAGAFSAYLGLVPSEDSSGDKTSRGGITKTGNTHARKAFVEAAWAQNRVKSTYVKIPEGTDLEVARAIRSINTRLKRRREHLLRVNKRKSCVANTAIAREMAVSFWILARLLVV